MDDPALGHGVDPDLVAGDQPIETTFRKRRWHHRRDVRFLLVESSVLALHGLTGKRFGFSAHDKSERRNKAIARWRAWIAGEGKTARLSFPLRPFGPGISYLGGNTLLAFGI